MIGHEVYFDNAATTFPKPEAVYQAMDQFMRQAGGSPGRSSHRRGREASHVVLETRNLLARLFKVHDPTRVIFTANATEALNLALKGLLQAGDHVITTSMEHNSVARPLAHLRDRGVETTIVPCHADGSLDPQEIKKHLKPNTRLIAVNHASNVVGTILPIGEIGQIAHQKGALLLVDAAQTAGCLPLDVDAQHIDLLAFAGHKGLFGPQGTGGLYIREGINPQPLKEGGTGRNSEDDRQPGLMPDKYESGTLNAVGLAGLGSGVQFILDTGVETIRAHEQNLTARLMAGLRGINGLTLYGPSAEQRVAVVSFNLRGQTPTQVGYALDQVYGIMARHGLHCAPLAHRTIGSFSSGGTVRFSLSYFNTAAEVDDAVQCVAQLAKRP